MAGKVRIGRTVLYSLTALDAQLINARRLSRSEQQDAVIEGRIQPGTQVHEGAAVAAGQQFPALVVRVFNDGRVNLKVQLDGNDDHWATCRQAADRKPEPGQWITRGRR